MDGAITVAEVIIMDGAEAEATITDGIIAIGDCRPRNQRSADTLPVIEMDASAAVSDRALDRKQREMAAKVKRRSRASCSASRTRQRTSATAKPSWNQLLSCRCRRRRKQRRGALRPKSIGGSWCVPPDLVATVLAQSGRL